MKTDLDVTMEAERQT